MKKYIVQLTLLLVAVSTSFAQSDLDLEKINKWSIEGSVGVTKPYQNFNPGYYAKTPDFLVTDFGVRYMISEYFGLKMEFGYNQFINSSSSLEFTTNQYRMDLQGVLNVGRVLKFENWTNSFNVLAHAGAGAGVLNYETTGVDGDKVGILIAGVTGQVKLSPRVAMNLDISGYSNMRQNESFNGGIGNVDNMGLVFNGTVGLSVYLGKNKKHADWHSRDEERYQIITTKINTTESKVNDAEEKVETNVQEVEKVKNDIEDLTKKVTEIEEKLVAEQKAKIESESSHNYVARLLEDGYVNIYFDFNSSVINSSAVSSINFLKSYLEKNPDQSVKLVGYADVTGDEKYNLTLSENRAKAVHDLLVKLGIDDSRLSYEGMGEDRNIPEGSGEANQLARRVSFSLNEGGTTISMPDANEINETVRINIKINPVHFVEDKFYLTDYSKGKLDDLVQILNENSKYAVNLYAYTDNMSSTQYNEEISLKRINSVIQYLESKGIEESRINNKEVKGAVSFIGSNDTAEGRLLNRRVEFEIVKF
ncbi:OmpA family protein [Sunxiuqinia sp. A32]|uniref:OmpA family protein n=1 Tax=Sunxiuqinia sp. A32 TaxID=3461496 RepID=UPI0040457C8C